MVSVVLATLNEAENIVDLIEALLFELRPAVEIVVVDDDSSDGTWQLVEEASRNHPEIRLLRRHNERGLASAIQAGIDAARGEIVVWMDCDFSHPPSLIPDLIAQLKEGADVAVASRYAPGGADLREESFQRLLSRILSHAGRALLSSKFRDYTSGFLATRQSVLESIRLQGDYGEYFMAFIWQAMQQGFVVREVPFSNYSRTRGESKTATHPLGFIWRGRKYLSQMLDLSSQKFKAPSSEHSDPKATQALGWGSNRVQVRASGPGSKRALDRASGRGSNRAPNRTPNRAPLPAAPEEKHGAQRLVDWSTPELSPAPGFGRVIPVFEPLLAGNEEKYVAECVRSTWISSKGEFLTRFEQAFAEYCGVRHAIAVSNGTAALHLSLHAMGIGPGDEVILPTFTIVACANMIRLTGATPVFADVDPRTYTLDPNSVKARLTHRTKAIMPVHIYGHPCDMDSLRDIAKANELWLLEDAAQGFGAEVNGQRAGALGDAAAFSLYANKTITTGEGGMITTNNDALAAVIRESRDQGFFKPTHFWHRRLGFNYRLTNLQAAVGLAQMERADELVAGREAIAARYDELLASLPGIVLPPRSEGLRNVFWMYAILVEEAFGMSRERLMQGLARRGIETRTFFIPLHLQPIYYRDSYEGQFPVAERIAAQGLYLPSAPSLGEEELVYIGQTLASLAKGAEDPLASKTADQVILREVAGSTRV